MKVIIGLGNPGKNYTNTRHNAGFLFIDFLISKSETSVRIDEKSFTTIAHITLFGKKILAARTATFMNESGTGVKMVLNKYSIKDLADVYVVHDDLDLVLGSYKIQKGKGPKIHNGVSSVEETIGKDFWHIRIGVDNRAQGTYVRGESYVLSNFTEEEKSQLNDVCNRIYTSPEFTSVVGGNESNGMSFVSIM